MGKKNRMTPLEQSRYIQAQGEAFGVRKEDFESDRYSDGGRYDTLDQAAYEKEIMRRARVENEIALRDAQNSGNKHFTDLEGVKGLSTGRELRDFDNAMKKFGKKELGQKNTSSVNDFGNIRAALYKESRDMDNKNMTSGLDAKYASAARLNELQDSIQKRSEETGPTEISSTLTNAQRSVGAYDEEKASQGANIYGAMGPANDLELAREEVQTNEASGDGQDGTNREDYTEQYKLNVKGGLELSGIETRGPNSGLMRDGSGFG